MRSHILTTTDGQYYTGRAGPAWVSHNRAEAFPLGAGEAAAKAALFNGRTVLHGLTFRAVEA